MITKQRFSEIDTEVKNVINEVFDYMKLHNQMNYILLLAEGEYLERYNVTQSKLNPFVIDSRHDRYKDETRLNFLTDFLTKYYSFANNQQAIDNNLYRMNIELMVYSHIWESKPFLKKLYRISTIVAGNNFEWQVELPEKSKHEFIRNTIRPNFEKYLVNVSNIMKKGFHTSLRNAFAHSEYSFDTMNNKNRIWLDTYTGKPWDIQEISFDEWSERFIFSSLFCYYITSISYDRRKNISADFGTEVFEIDLPNSLGTKEKVRIKYKQEHDDFSFI